MRQPLPEDLKASFLSGGGGDSQGPLLELMMRILRPCLLSSGVRPEDVEDELQEICWYLARKAKPSQAPYFEKRMWRVFGCRVKGYHARKQRERRLFLPLRESGGEGAEASEASESRDKAIRSATIDKEEKRLVEVVSRRERGESREIDEGQGTNDLARSFLVELALLTYAPGRDEAVRRARDQGRGE